MRIITGQYKGRHFDIPRSFKARPTTDFAKENIFNVLQGYIDFEDTSALDLFAGTGSISLELVSRGCSRVISVEAEVSSKSIYPCRTLKMFSFAKSVVGRALNERGMSKWRPLYCPVMILIFTLNFEC
jgi:16S rRNA G966 N2-methylase RsmD